MLFVIEFLYIKYLFVQVLMNWVIDVWFVVVVVNVGVFGVLGFNVGLSEMVYGLVVYECQL